MSTATTDTLQTTYPWWKWNQQTDFYQTDLIWLTIDSKLTNSTDKRQIETSQWLMTNLTWVFQPMPSWLNWPWNHFQWSRLLTSLPDKHHSLDSEDDFSSGCRNFSHQFNSSSQNYPHSGDHTMQTTKINLCWKTGGSRSAQVQFCQSANVI